MDSPTYAPLVRETFKGIRREIDTAQKFKQALLSPEIRQMVACCPENLCGLRDKALCLCSYAMAARRSEAAALRVEDVTAVLGPDTPELYLDPAAWTGSDDGMSSL